MNTIRNVFIKEVTDNFRDRRTLMSALLMGPLFGPILFAFVINLSVSQSLSNENEALDLPVIGSEHAPNLITFLESNNINIVAGPETREEAIDAVSNGEQDCPGRIEIKLKLVEAEDESDKQHPAYLVDHTLLN